MLRTGAEVEVPAKDVSGLSVPHPPLPAPSPNHGLQTSPRTVFCFVFLFVWFWPSHGACGILVPQLGIEPLPLAMEVWGLNHWTSREVSALFFILSGAQRVTSRAIWVSGCSWEGMRWQRVGIPLALPQLNAISSSAQADQTGAQQMTCSCEAFVVETESQMAVRPFLLSCSLHAVLQGWGWE